MLKGKTITLINKIFPFDERENIISMLNECGKHLPLIMDENPLAERIIFAAIKVSDGDTEEFNSALELAKIDWRDLLVWAGFEHNVNEHNIWADTALHRN